MHFYIVDENFLRNVLENQGKVLSVESSGIPVDLMVTGFKKIAKDFKTMEDLNGHNIFIVRGCDVSVNDGKIYQIEKAKSGGGTHMIVLPNSNVVEMNTKIGELKLFVKIDNETLKLSTSVENLKETMVQSGDISKKEKLAELWLRNGRVGVSSQTMCNKLFPKLTFRSDSRDVPYDNSDFIRCMGFIEAIGGLDDDEWAKIAKINKKWKKLVENWAEIEKNVALEDEGKRREAYNLIKSCINIPAKRDKP